MPVERVVRGAFVTREMAARAVDEMIAGGFDAGSVSVLDRRGHLADVTPEGGQRRRIYYGAGIGAVVGGVLWSLLVFAGQSALPGVTGMVLGAVAGGFVAYLSGRRPSAAELRRRIEQEAPSYFVEAHIPAGQASRAEMILNNAGAVSVSADQP